MNHLKGYNEELFWRKRKHTKDDMYIQQTHKNWKRMVNEPPKGKSFAGKHFQDFSLIKDYIIKDSIDENIFVNNKGDYFHPYKFKSSVRGDDVWYDVGNVFEKLRVISDELGYKINTNVVINTTNTINKIVDIQNFTFYEIHNGTFTQGIDAVFTLVYKVEDDSNWYQIGHLDISPDVAKISVVEDAVKDNFLHLLDEDIIEYVTTKTKYGYNVDIMFNQDITPDYLDKVTTCLQETSGRLLENNIELIITQLSMSGIQFKAIQRPTN